MERSVSNDERKAVQSGGESSDVCFTEEITGNTAGGSRR